MQRNDEKGRNRQGEYSGQQIHQEYLSLSLVDPFT